MFLFTSEELSKFFCAQGIAFFLCIIYDFLQSLAPKNRSQLIGSFFDGFSWFLICGAFLMLWQEHLMGELRWYTLLSFCLTAMLYYFTIHKPIFSTFCIIAKKIYSFFYTIFKILLTVVHFFSKIFIYVSVICKKIYSVDYKGNCYEEK